MNAHMKRLVVGIGCRRGASVEQIDAAVRSALGPHAIDDIRAIATIDIKAQEPGIVDFCARHALPLHVFSRGEIAAASALAAAGQTSAQASAQTDSQTDAQTTVQPSAPSSMVRAHVGVDGVCEPCALLAAPEGRLIAPKRAFDGGVTVAIAIVDSVAHATFDHEPSRQQYHQDAQ
jgi:cobalt-precorrin 5A hydrolase